MSAHCDVCGDDLSFPSEEFPEGACGRCELQKKYDVVKDLLDRAMAELECQDMGELHQHACTVHFPDQSGEWCFACLLLSEFAGLLSTNQEGTET